MAKKKAAEKKTKRGARQNGKNAFQTDDPIIVKPGNSITMEFDSKFGRQANPSATRRKRKHATANALTAVWIYRSGAGTPYPLNPGDYVVICYDLCGHCP